MRMWHAHLHDMHIDMPACMHMGITRLIDSDRRVAVTLQYCKHRVEHAFAVEEELSDLWCVEEDKGLLGLRLAQEIPKCSCSCAIL